MILQYTTITVSNYSILLLNFAIEICDFQFEIDELDQNKCSVSHCTVSRNLLSRWRLAAIDMFKFPPHLPMNLHICPEAERDKWISGK